MNFADPQNLLYLWALIPAALLCYLAEKKRRARLQKMMNARILDKLHLLGPRGRRVTKISLWVISLMLIIIALARPRLGFEWKDVKRRGVDIMIAVDVSQSMLAQDINPNRLERAKREIIDLLQMLKGDRVGLLAFAGIGFVQCPLTLDYNAVRMFIDYLDPDLIPVQGTNLGDAIELSLNSLAQDGGSEKAAAKAVILITDGEDQSDTALKLADQAAEKGIKIFTIGMGQVGGAPIPEQGGGFKKDQAGNLVMSKLDESALQSIAQKTGGVYVRSVSGDLDLERIYLEGIKLRTEDQDLEDTRIRVWYERFQWFVLLAFILLLIEYFFNPARKVPKRDSASVQKAALILLVVLAGGLSITDKGYASESDAVSAFEQGDFAQSEQYYSQQIQDKPHPRDYYNRGVTRFQQQKFAEAEKDFQQAATSEDQQIAGAAHYNLGLAQSAQQNFEGAVQSFKNALALNPEDQAAKENLAWAQKMLEQKQQQQQQQNQDQQDQDNKDQKDQQNQDQQQNQQNQDQQNKQDQQQDQKDQQQQDQQQNQDQQNKQDQQDQQQQNQQDQQQQQQSQQNESSSAEQNQSQQSEQQPQSPEEQQKQLEQQQAEKLLRRIEDKAAKYMFFRREVQKRPPKGKDW